MVKYKHGFISAQFVGEDDYGQDNIFYTYIWEDKEFFGYFWMPIEEFHEITGWKYV